MIEQPEGRGPSLFGAEQEGRNDTISMGECGREGEGAKNGHWREGGLEGTMYVAGVGMVRMMSGVSCRSGWRVWMTRRIFAVDVDQGGTPGEKGHQEDLSVQSIMVEDQSGQLDCEPGLRRCKCGKVGCCFRQGQRDSG